MLTEKQKFEILQTTSGHFLCEEIPDDWYDLTEEQQNEFMTDHSWQPFENHSVNQVWGIIEDAALSAQLTVEGFSKPPKQPPTCKHCGSEELSVSGWMNWNIEKQQWDTSTLDSAVCGNCGQSGSFENMVKQEGN